MNREMVLDTAKEYIMNDRAATHGNAEDSFAAIAALWSAYIGEDISPIDVAAMMILLKTARIKANPRHDDNWVDIAGYAACGSDVAANYER
jgi:hypothetical protein